jgi:hypothetical protein
MYMPANDQRCQVFFYWIFFLFSLSSSAVFNLDLALPAAASLCL